MTLCELAVAPRLPYHDSSFSERVLQLHLNQRTDQSSRRRSIIARQCEWIADRLGPFGKRSVLHPMCGPGLFASALADAGVQMYRGLDIAPAAIRYAVSKVQNPRYKFRHADILSNSRPSSRFTAAILTYEALNQFPPYEAEFVLQKIAMSVTAGGTLLSEIRPVEANEALLPQTTEEYYPAGSLFAVGPHALLTERDHVGAGGCVVANRFTVMREGRTASACYYSAVWTYSTERLREMLEMFDFSLLEMVQPVPLGGDMTEADHDVFLVARKRS